MATHKKGGVNTVMTVLVVSVSENQMMSMLCVKPYWKHMA